MLASALHFTEAYHIQQDEVDRNVVVFSTQVVTAIADRANDSTSTIVQFPNARAAKGMAALKNLWEKNPCSVKLSADQTLQGS